MTTPVIDLGAFAGNRDLEEGVLRSLVSDNHLPEQLAERADAYGALHDKAALGVQVAVDPADGSIKGSTFRFMGRNNAMIITTSASAISFWEECNKAYKLTVTVGVN